MRLAAVLILLVAQSARAKCAQFGFTVEPSRRPLPTNGVIVVEGFGSLSPLVKDIERYSPKLVAAGQEVPLELVTMNLSKLSSQAVLRPARPLEPSTQYTVSLRDLGAKEKQLFEAMKRSLPAATKITTARGPDVARPGWAGEPSGGTAHYHELSCGPAFGAMLKVPLEPSSDVWVRVAYTSKGSTTVRWATVERGALDFGQGMCGGPFDVEKGATYRLEVAPLDAAGNASAEPQPLTVTVPSR